MAAPGPPETINLREAWQAPILDAVLLTAIMAAFVSHSHGTAATAAVVIWLLLLLGELYRLARPVAVLTPTEIQVNGLHRAQLPWASIQDVRSEKKAGSTHIVLITDDGGRTVMDAPTASLLSSRRRFDTAIETVRTQWVAHRGPTWTAKPTTSAADARTE